MPQKPWVYTEPYTALVNRRLHVVKVSVLHLLIYKFKFIWIKISIVFWRRGQADFMQEKAWNN